MSVGAEVVSGGQGATGVTTTGIAALRDMRRARRRHFVEQLDVMEVLYRVYVGVIFAGIAIALLAGAVSETPAGTSALAAIRDHGPAVLGLAVALGALVGARSGARGGPLAIEPAEVQYVLLAPVDRGSALRPAALRQLRTGAIGGAVVGAVFAAFAMQRLPGSPVEWIACLALFGALLPVCVLAAALLASGHRLGPLAAGGIGLALLAWSLADLLLGWNSSPATMLGDLATLPLQSGTPAALAAVGVAAILALVAAGLLGIGGVLLEAALNRAQLVAELRFSASVQDLRTVVLLRRQLASERPRRRPWLRVRQRRVAAPAAIRARAWQSFLRWPPARLVRVLVLAAAAGAVAALAWHVSVLLLVLPGLLLIVAALDLIDPLAQEADHPTRAELLPLPASDLFRRHVVAPAIALAALVLFAAIVAAAVSAEPGALGVGVVMALPTGLALSCCAAFSATNDPYAYVGAPQLGYMQSGAPLAVAAVATGAPVAIARASWLHGGTAALAALPVEIFLAGIGMAAVAGLGARMAAREAEA